MADDVVVAISSINNMAAGISGAINDLQRLQSNVQSMGGSTSPVQSSLSSLGEGFRTVLGHVQNFAGGILNAINPLNLFHSSAMRLLEVMAVWRMFEYGTQKIQEFLSGIFQIPIAMEKAQTSWAYMFNSEPTPGQNLNAWLATGQGNAAQIMNWTKKFSINIPYTRQDLIQAITTLSASNLTTGGVEQYLPVLADIAAVRAPGTPLQMIAQAVQEGEFGLTRMLRTQLHLMPEQLAPYGYDESNFSTMLPALQQYSMAHGLTNWVNGQDQGAAFKMAHGTFWGELSSFWDRIQNSEWATGEAGPFQTLKGGLEWLNSFMDNNSGKIQQWATLFGSTLSDAMQTAGKAFLGLAQGLQDSGLGRTLDSVFSGLDQWFKDPNVQKNIQFIVQSIGKAEGSSASGFVAGAQAATSGFGAAWSNLGPQGQAGIINLLTIPGMLGNVLGLGVGGIFRSLPGWGQFLGGGASLFGDVLHGHPERFGHDLLQMAGGYGSAWNEGMRPIGSIYDAVLNWAGVNTHGAGARWVNQRITDMGKLGGGLNQWLGSLGGGFGGWLGSLLGGGGGGGGGSALHMDVSGLLPNIDVDSVNSWVGKLDASITSGMSKLMRNFHQMGTDLFNHLLQGLMDALPNLSKFFTGLEQKVAGEFGQILRTPGGWRVPGIPGVG